MDIYFSFIFTSVFRVICDRFIISAPFISTIIITIFGITGPLIIFGFCNMFHINQIITKPFSTIMMFLKRK